jgi:hypothetical protein
MYRENVRHGGTRNVFVTDTGEWNSMQMAHLLGLSRDGWTQRIRRYGYTDERLLNPKMRMGHFYDPTVGNDEWRQLGDTDRRSVNEIKIGDVERYAPDPYDEQKVKQYDREYFV